MEAATVKSKRALLSPTEGQPTKRREMSGSSCPNWHWQRDDDGSLGIP